MIARGLRKAAGLALVLACIGGCSLLVDTSGHEFHDGGDKNGLAGSTADGGRDNRHASAPDGTVDASTRGDGGAGQDAGCADPAQSDTARCAPAAACGDLDCGPQRSCVADADGARCACPVGKGWDAEHHACVTCDSIPRCAGAGETGALLARSTDGSSCLCETRNGYFYSAPVAAAVECDADGDGFTNQDAVAAAAASDRVERDNARCNVRRVQAIVLQNETGDAHSVDLTDDFPLGLPLYESARNDGANDASALPRYWLGQGRVIAAREVNSLTKACVSAGADFNDDGVPDVDEWSGSTLDPERYGIDAELLRASRKYVEFSYFLKLHDGWYEAPTSKRNLALFRIAEKSRAHDDTDGVPLRYPEKTPDYVDRCLRHVDSLYSGDSPNTIDGDFSAYDDDAEMTHHSQFKCVRIMGESSYKQAQATETNAPQRVYRKDGALARLDADGHEHSYTWTVNDCYADDGAEAPPRQGAMVNPRFTHVHCEPNDAPTLDTVRWAAVGYEAYDTAYKSYFDKGAYVRGCANECVEQLDPKPVASDCMHCTTGDQGEGTLVSDDAGADCDDTKVCDGEGNCGDCVPKATSCAATGDGTNLCSSSGEWHGSIACSGTDRACADGTCVSCVGDLRDCNEQSSDGCETDVMNGTPTACSDCGMACSTTHTTPQCAGGACSGPCDQGWDDCNNDKRADGCEVDVSSNFDRCGSCGGVCTQDHVSCASAACVPCAAGYANCDRALENGCEIVTGSDNANCGVCGQVCAVEANYVCIQSVCTYVGCSASRMGSQPGTLALPACVSVLALLLAVRRRTRRSRGG